MRIWDRAGWWATFAVAALAVRAGGVWASGPSQRDEARAGASAHRHRAPDPSIETGALARGSAPQAGQTQRPPEATPVSWTTASAPEGEHWPSRIETRLNEIAARPAGAGSGRDHAGLAQRLSALTEGFPEAVRVGVLVRDLDTHATIYEHRADDGFNPASNQKLLTSIAALELLGPDYRFDTELWLDGDRLVVVGHGDPSLSPADLWALLDRAEGLVDWSSIAVVAVDDSAFSAASRGPEYDLRDDGDSYLAPSGALSLNFNTIEVTVRGGATRGDAVRVSVWPEGAGVVADVRARTGAGQPVIESIAGEATTVIRVRGSVGPYRRVTERRHVHDPGRFAGEVLAAMIARRSGHEAPDVRRETLNPTARRVARHRSQPLVTLLSSAMRYSNNFTSEQILRTLAHRATGRPGSFEDGVAVLKRFVVALGHPEDSIVIVNGSGLSKSGRVSPRVLVDVLALAASSSAIGPDILAAMATVGGEGTLHSRVHVGRGRVRAKTGTIGGASALSGVVSSRDGRRSLAFSILVNGPSAVGTRAQQDRIVASLVAAAG